MTPAEYDGRVDAQFGHQVWQFAMMPRDQDRAVRRALSEPRREPSDLSVSERLLNRYS
jgi:hypothetical protein